MADRILLVDDEPNNLELLEGILASEGYECARAQDGPEALAAVGASPPDLILLDLMMPGMNGLEVCQRLKGDPATADIPVIVVTAMGQIATKESALVGGADDFVAKPVRAEDLRARVAAMLKVRRIRAELDRTLAYVHELEAARHARRRAALATLGGGAQPPDELLPAPMRVLLVDDEALTRQFYGDLLAEHGFVLFTAASGPEALDLLGRQEVDAVVLDIVMAGMSGLAVLERIREIDPDLPVIMLTGHVSSQNAIAALKLGAFDFIVKGLDHSLVVLSVHRAVRHRREVRKQKEETAMLRAQVAALGPSAAH
jgi:two-component system cell cycle response regulator